MKAFCYTENIFGSLCAVGMRIMNWGTRGPKPIVHRPSHLHNGSHLRPRTIPVVRFVHVLCCVAFLSTLLSFSLSRYTTVCSMHSSRFNISRRPRARRSSTFSRPKVGLLVRHLSLPLLPYDRVVPLWAQTRLDPEPWLFSPYPPKLSKWMQPTVPLLYVYTRPPIGTYVR